MQRYSRSFVTRNVNTASVLAAGATASASFGCSSTPAPAAGSFNWQQVRFQATAPKKARSPYKILGVKQSATVQELKKAHRVLARKFHPDVPGGSHEKFQEIQDAFEQVKSGVWIRKAGEPREGESADGAEKPQNRYANFRFTTGGNRRKQNYDETFSNLHKNKDSTPDDDLDREAHEQASGKRKGPALFGPDSPLFQAWSRLIVVWSCGFVFFRTALFLTFPPKYEKVHKKKMMSDRLQRRPPPPKPLVASTPVGV